MALYNYPQSSCPCYNCDKKKYKFAQGTPSNLSIPFCITPDLYECYDGYIFKKSIEPTRKDQKNDYINNQVTDQYNNTPGFGRIETCLNSCPKYSYLSSDPRLTVAVRGIRMPLDRPPLDSSVPLKDIYKDELTNYGQDYQTYKDIGAGQILYYTGKDREDAYYEPLFDKQAHSVGVLYKDPMDNIKPHYDRIPIGKQPNPSTDTKNNLDGYGLSWLRDSQNQRQNILASQMAKINQQRWEPRWTNIQDNATQTIPVAYNCN